MTFWFKVTKQAPLEGVSDSRLEEPIANLNEAGIDYSRYHLLFRSTVLWTATGTDLEHLTSRLNQRIAGFCLPKFL